MYKAIQTSRVYEQIVSQIEELISKGSLKPGDQLPAERELAQQFGVSRTAVREAVRALHERGLLEAYAGRGTFVTNGKRPNVLDSLGRATNASERESSAHLAELRAMLEPEIAAQAAVQSDEQHITAMREAIAVMDQAVRDPDVFVEADLDFHLALAEAVGNPIILSLIDSIVGLLREQRIRISQVEGGPQRGQSHHKRILAAIERQDPNGAREAMREHLRQVRDDLASIRAD